jgi:hypothetical protein
MQRIVTLSKMVIAATKKFTEVSTQKSIKKIIFYYPEKHQFYTPLKNISSFLYV